MVVQFMETQFLELFLIEKNNFLIENYAVYLKLEILTNLLNTEIILSVKSFFHLKTTSNLHSIYIFVLK